MSKIIIELNIEDNIEDKYLLDLISKKDNIHSFLFELRHNFYRNTLKHQPDMTSDELYDKLTELAEEHDVYSLTESLP